MSVNNVANIIGGPCLVFYKDSIFRSKADVTMAPNLSDFEIEIDSLGVVDTRAGNQELKLTFIPEGRFADLDVLFPHLSANYGSLVTPVWPCGAVDFGNDKIAVANTALPAGTPISFGTTGAMPAGLTSPTLYYLGANAGGFRKIHLSAAAAEAGTGAIDITDAGTGSLKFVEQHQLIIIGNDGRRVTFHNAAVTKMPEITGEKQTPLWGQVEFECFVKNGVDRTDANSVLTEDTAAFSDEGFDPADIITQPYTMDWGEDAPWVEMSTKAGIKITPTLELSPVDNQAAGILSRRILKIGVTLTAQPIGIDFASLRAKLNLDGSGSKLGRSLAGDDLNIQGTGVYVRVYAAALTGGPAQWKRDDERVGELTWKGNRTFTGGVPNPMLYIGAEAPA